jgi:hypothetical protein
MRFVKSLFTFYLALLLALLGSAQTRPDNKKPSPTKYDEIAPFENGISKVRKGSLFGVIDKNQKEIVPLNFEEEDLRILSGGYIAYYEYESGWGLKDNTGKQILAPTYSNFSDIRFGLICTSFEDGWILINLKGKRVNPTLFYEPVNWDWDEGMSGTASVKVWSKSTIPNKAEGQILMGLINKKGEFILLPVFDWFKPINNNYWVVHRNNKIALLTLKGDTSIPYLYDGIDAYNEKYFSVELNKKFGLVDAKGKIILPIKYEILNPHYFDFTSNPKCEFASKVGRISIDGLQTFILPNLTFLTKPIYQDLKPFVNNIAAVKRENLWTFIDTTGKEIASPQFEEVLDFDLGLYASVKKESKWGLINTSGKLVTPICYDYALGSPNGHNKVDVCRNGKYGKLDSNLSEIIPCLYDIPIERLPGFVKKNGKVALVNKDGKLYSDFKFDYIGDVLNPEKSFQYSSMRIGSKWGFIDNKGKVLFAPQFDEVFGGSYDSYWVKLGSNVGFINAAAKFIIPCKYQDILYLNNALFGVKTNDLYTFLDSNSLEILFAPRFEDIQTYSEGYVPVRINNKWGFANRKGGIAIPCAYEYVLGFSEGRAAVKLFGKWGFIDKSGTMVIQAKYDSPGFFFQNSVLLEIDNKLIRINRSGEIVK